MLPAFGYINGEDEELKSGKFYLFSRIPFFLLKRRCSWALRTRNPTLIKKQTQSNQSSESRIERRLVAAVTSVTVRRMALAALVAPSW